MKMRKVILAMDSFKGCMSSVEANRAAADGVRSVWPGAEVLEVPVSDGGEGFLEAFHVAIGGELVTIPVKDPLQRNISARYLLKGETAVVEIAEAIGLTLLSPEERNPMTASSYGVGQLVADAVKRGARHIIVGLGGSATSDAGKGMLQALTDAFGQCSLAVSASTAPAAPAIPPSIRFTIATDVENPLYGENGAAQVFGPQKGATLEMVRLLDDAAWQFADDSARQMGFDRSQMKGAGAAGGLGYAFMQYLDAHRKSGIELLLETIGFDALARDADLIITGEGSADSQTLMGKLPMGILRHSAGVPVCLLAGKVSDRQELLRAGFAHVESINPSGLPLEEAMKKTVAEENIRRFFRNNADCQTNSRR